MERTVHDWFTSSLPTWRYWRGVPMQKNPIDLQLYHEAIQETKPEMLVETGTMHGGSALFFESTMWGIEWDEPTYAPDPLIFTFDVVDRSPYPYSANIRYVTEDSATTQVPHEWLREVEEEGSEPPRVMVVLDSDHTAEHVRLELANLAHLVTPGCYLVVEDTSHTEAWQAVEDWRAHHPEFRPVDMSRYLCTYNTWMIREET